MEGIHLESGFYISPKTAAKLTWKSTGDLSLSHLKTHSDQMRQETHQLTQNVLMKKIIKILNIFSRKIQVKINPGYSSPGPMMIKWERVLMVRQARNNIGLLIEDKKSGYTATNTQIVWKQPIYGDLTKRLFLCAVCSVTPYSQPVKKCWGKTDGWPTSRYSLCPPHSLTSQNMEITFSFCPQDVCIMGSLGHCLIMDQHRLLGNCQ